MYLIHSDRFAIKSHLVHDSGSIFRVLLRYELDESKPLMRLRYSVLGQMYVHLSSLQLHILA
jgi:hypothetical protein